jgi:Tat protein secretion system quality control protein TatD with DNase activity
MNIVYITYVLAKKNHLPLTLPLYDGYCHVDLFFKYGLNYHDFNIQLSHGRKMIYIDNRQQHYRWFGHYVIKNDNVKIYTTYGIHPKYIPSDPPSVLKQLENIFKNKFQLNTTTVAIGECEIDETSNCTNDFQLYIYI